MALSLIARTSARQAFTRGRSLHTTAPLRDAHGHYHHFPFAFPTKDNKGMFAVKLSALLLSGFSIPFAASYWQLRKASA